MDAPAAESVIGAISEALERNKSFLMRVNHQHDARSGGVRGAHNSVGNERTGCRAPGLNRWHSQRKLRPGIVNLAQMNCFSIIKLHRHENNIDSAVVPVHSELILPHLPPATIFDDIDSSSAAPIARSPETIRFCLSNIYEIV